MKALHLAQRWMTSICTTYPAYMAQLYCTQGILIPTLSYIREGREEIKDYFEYFMSREGLCGAYDEIIVQDKGKKCQIASGLYTFSFRENGQPQHVQARFSFVFDEKGLIVNHHSSAVPGE